MLHTHIRVTQTGARFIVKNQLFTVGCKPQFFKLPIRKTSRERGTNPLTGPPDGRQRTKKGKRPPRAPQNHTQTQGNTYGVGSIRSTIPLFYRSTPSKAAFRPQTDTRSPINRAGHISKPSFLRTYAAAQPQKSLLPEPSTNAEFAGAAPSQISRQRLRDDSFFSIVKRFTLMPVALEIFLHAGSKNCAVIQAVHSFLR